jgi:catechol 2,3-dioxygenase-like lactoylglutathione lyase family enzyme
MGNAGNDHRIDNIEFAVSDVARSREFSGKAFGWTFTDYGPTYCEFSDGRLTGGLTQSGHPHGPAAQRSTCLSYGRDLPCAGQDRRIALVWAIHPQHQYEVAGGCGEEHSMGFGRQNESLSN